MSKQKQLSMSKVAEENKMYNEYVELDVTVQGEEYTIKLYPFFKPEKVKKMLEEIVSFFQKAEEEKVKLKDEDEDGLIGYYVVKHFTDIKFSQSKKAKTIYKEYRNAINSKLFEVILKTIPEESMEYVYDKIFEFQELNMKLQSQMKKFKDEINNLNLENKDLLMGKSEDKKKQIPEV